MRIAEALSKMKLQPFATEADVEEALRLFQVSTLDAALSGTLSGERTPWDTGSAVLRSQLGALGGPGSAPEPGSLCCFCALAQHL